MLPFLSPEQDKANLQYQRCQCTHIHTSVHRKLVGRDLMFSNEFRYLLHMAVAPVQWLKLLSWKVGYREFEPRSGIRVSKKQHVSSLLIRKDSILWGASVTER